MTEHWTERLSEYVDDELPTAEAAAVEAHLAVCDECSALVADLRGIVAVARNLADTPPTADLWSGIADGIGGVAPDAPVRPVVIGRAIRRPAASRRVSFTIGQLAAASIALVLLSGGAVWLAMHGTRTAPADAVVSGQPIGVRQVDVRSHGTYYDAAISELEAVLERDRNELDPATVAVIEENIRSIDRAILDARTALEQDPSNLFLNEHLENAKKRKIQLLKRAAGMRVQG